METKLILAFVASVTSIIVATISLIGNYFTNRKLIKVNKNIELYKFELDKKRGKFQIFDNELKNNFRAVGEYIRQLQILKDFLLFTVNALEDSLDSDTVVSRIKELRENIFKTYEDNSHHLSNETLKNAHTTKNYIITIENEINELCLGREFVNLSTEEKNQIEEKRNILSDFQNVFRDVRMKMLQDVL